VVIIGGGFGGLCAARGLAGALVSVTLIDKRNYHLFRPMLYQVATGLLFVHQAFSETDQFDDLKKFDVPTLILHGDDDQIVPIGASAMQSSKLIKNAQLKVYKGGSHGMCTTEKEKVNDDLLAFIKA
jgi:pimeloyl-ACP methyl ester carboxylesterase